MLRPRYCGPHGIALRDGKCDLCAAMREVLRRGLLEAAMGGSPFWHVQWDPPAKGWSVHDDEAFRRAAAEAGY